MHPAVNNKYTWNMMNIKFTPNKEKINLTVLGIVLISFFSVEENAIHNFNMWDILSLFSVTSSMYLQIKIEPQELYV